ncbi:hypothetical protein NLU13_9083 [Sarocladium strictum]|uniref:Uncharacterized protein n=1 Tax=Sarocladium strictum TaxID=5046 RepID=A0AA39G9G9_SARSR|nr:hypothetical protein NLU13_9083 [Sarocladium strictum]
MVLTGVRISKIQGRVTRWKSLKAYMIIDYLEIVFWFAVVVLAFMGVSRTCRGETCALGVIVALIALLLSCFAGWLAIVATLDHRFFRSYGAERAGESK